ncbi:MAG: hypothetical protein US94_C0015G0004 [Berkelbacteria bacterium GW2011_GWB1_38_5]|uniref:DUF4012 domain-containing protein n=1 Tax=Berkelbacteria bacterium GW2011_GWB1_38_5 TaxID=1618336 RepID=A0A0G0NAA8_9BACT|nr:MAG: hypothetical protein US94_C0015G0004 [Berkelbacteria bacterium GW2011_GWB1_38_5]
MSKVLLIDSITKKKVIRSFRKRKIWLAPFIIVFLLISSFFVGRTAADFVLLKVDPVSLFASGKFLVIFQNNAEIRSSGGFIGSFAVMDIENYEIKSFNFNTNIYGLDRLYAEGNFIKAPEPINKMTKGQSWALRDANYDASFPDSAQDILYFYNQETGDSVDGIIALNASVMIDLLNLTGPINLEKYDTTISADNFYNETQYKIEKEYYESPENWVINEPKTFLKDLYPKLLQEALKNKVALVKLLNQELTQKEIVLYFQDANKQKIIETRNWAGKIPTDSELKDKFNNFQSTDYLYINSNSYSGNKSSINIKEDIEYKVNSDGLVNLKITRIHSGTNNWPDGKNTTWMRFFVPQGSTLVSAKNNEKIVTEEIKQGVEADKTFFGVEAVIEPGEASILELNYILPFEIKNYQLLVQKQPGIRQQNLSVFFNGQNLFNGVLNTDKEIK